MFSFKARIDLFHTLIQSSSYIFMTATKMPFKKNQTHTHAHRKTY